jgi:flagellar biosynthetic protein FliP
VSPSSVIGIFLTLGVVLTLVGVTLRLLRGVSQRASVGSGGMRLEVVQRVAVGPRQGIAVVRVGDQLLAVSVGEGGVRTLAELDESPETAVEALEPAHQPGGRHDFRSMLRQGLRAAGLPMASMLFVLSFAMPVTASAQSGGAPPATLDPRPATPSTLDAVTRALPQIDLKLNEGEDGLRLSGAVGVVVLMGALTLLPTLILLMSSFTRILIVMHFLKQALGTQTAPPAHLMTALALLLTGFVMAPTLSEVNQTAITPWMEGKIEQPAMMAAAIVPMRGFMLRQVQERDLQAFIEMSDAPAPASADEVSTVVLMSAFVTSELRTAFQLGFVLFLPFIVIDVVVSSVLMSMGMFMLPPAMISLPFKLLLFVLVDGWSLLIQSLVQGFR